MQIKQWNVADVEQGTIDRLVGSTELPPLVCKVLSARCSEDSAQEYANFLEDDFQFESPFLIKDMIPAVERIHEAVENGEKIAIYGDYDCDGITSTALLMSYLQSIGADVFYYIPRRETEGYGMNRGAIDKLHAHHTDLIITVDNGITAHDEIAYATELGMDTVVTDHHTPRETLPNAVAVVNPHRADCPSVFKEYAGVGVAFQLVCALEDADPTELLEFYSDLVTLGTIADLMPLHGANRAIVKHGLTNLDVIARPGMKALMEIGKINPPFSTESLSFGIAPRINAAGRMGSAEEAVELLMTEDETYALEIAEKLQDLNIQRRGIEEAVLKEIQKKLRDNPEILLQRVLIVSGEGWHPGVMGIVASRLMDQYGKPTIAFTINNGVAKGSGRSLAGFSLIDAVTECREHLSHFGGHTLAAGMTIAEEDLPEFDRQIQSFAGEHYAVMPVPSYHIDAEIKLNELSVEAITAMEALSPFGSGNPSPVFVLRELTLAGIYPTADEKHLRLKFSSNGQEITTIYFRMSSSHFPYKIGDKLDAVVAVDLNEWKGTIQLSIKIQDVRSVNYPQQEAITSYQRYLSYRRGEFGKNCEKENLKPTREEQEMVYRTIRTEKSFSYGAIALWEKMMGQGIDLARLQIILDAFGESGLIQRKNGILSLVDNPPKVDLMKSKTFKQIYD